MSGEFRERRQVDPGADGRDTVAAFVSYLPKEVKFDIDAPADPAGEWLIDVHFERSSTSVAWRSGLGFGIYTADEDAYGERPDEIYRDPCLAAKRLAQLAAADTQQRASAAMRLRDLRNLVEKQQTAIAGALNKNQAAVSRLENQNDALLSTVREYIEALGGKVMVMAKFHDFEAPIDIARVGKSLAKTKKAKKKVTLASATSRRRKPRKKARYALPEALRA